MKNSILLAFFLILTLGLFSENVGTVVGSDNIVKEVSKRTSHDLQYVIPDLPKDALGIYLPVVYVDALRLLKCHQQAMLKIKGLPDYMLITKDRIYESGSYDDGYSVRNSDFVKFDLSKISNGKIRDERGNEFIRIASTSQPSDISPIKFFIVNELFKDWKNRIGARSDFEIVDVGFVYNGTLFEIDLDSVYEPHYLDRFVSGNSAIGISITDDSLVLYSMLPVGNDPGYYVDKKLLSIGIATK
jgi:hypothetical protein